MALRKREKPILPSLTLWNAEGAVAYEGMMAGLTIPEPVVLALSIEFFGDPEPCYIHRAAVLTRAAEELSRAAPRGVRISVSSLPDGLCRYLSAYEAAWLEVRS